MNRVGFIIKPSKPEASSVLDRVVPWLVEQGKTPIFVDEEHPGLPDAVVVPEAGFAQAIDIAVVLGGDGTMLRACALVADNGIPVLGINLGRLGFLTPFAPDNALEVLARAFDGTLAQSDRMRLAVTFTPGHGDPVAQTALNDVVIHQGAMARLVEIDARLDGDLIAAYRADGLIVSTPTGSTAYNLAAGGPIITPHHEAMALTPICAHALTNRPLVVPHKGTISITLGGDSRGVVLTVDGRWARTFQAGDRIDITALARPLITYESEKPFFDILREKLHWDARL